ncbi:histone H1A, sperm-like [Armigeres subalbatus]|uniref:histone H1A, sperm-like n=1 Tax=Armigeres subalbatus TaxID=124917 RepID=UPI002ED4B7D8
MSELNTGFAATFPTADPQKHEMPKEKPAVAKVKPAKHPNRAKHLPVQKMIATAIKTLNNSKGSSLYAIKRYIEANYECDIGKLSPFIRKSLKTAVDRGTLIRTKGIGASGSFKLPKNLTNEKRKRKETIGTPDAVKKRTAYKQIGTTSKLPNTPFPKITASTGKVSRMGNRC